MAISLFEAISFYEYSRNKDKKDLPSLLHMVIFHADDYSVGFCTCTKEGQIKTVRIKTLSEKSSCMDDINQSFCKVTRRQDSISDCVNTNIDAFNKKMKMYYQSEKQMNPDFKDTLGIDLDCAGFDKIFTTACSRLEKLLSELDDLWSETQFDESDSRFMIVGKAALYYPITYCIKDFLTFDPFLADDRFVSDNYSDQADEIASIGEQAYNKEIESKRNIFIKLVKADGAKEKEKIPVLDEDAKIEELKYLEPILVAADEPLEFEIHSKKKLIDLPYSLEALDCDVIEIGAFVVNRKPVIRIRRYHHPTRIYDIPVV